MSSESEFAYSLKYNTHFIVKNTCTDHNKTISIFHYPINFGCNRDLLQIPGIQEADIRASLLKGELRHKFLCGDIELISSNIDLLQFSDKQRAWLYSFGFSEGVQIGTDELAIIEQQDIQLIGAVDGSNTIYTIPSGIWIQSAPYKIIIYKNGVKQVLGDDYIIAEGSGPGTGYNTVIMTIPPDDSCGYDDIITADYYINNV